MLGPCPATDGVPHRPSVHTRLTRVLEGPAASLPIIVTPAVQPAPAATLQAVEQTGVPEIQTAPLTMPTVSSAPSTGLAEAFPASDPLLLLEAPPIPSGTQPAPATNGFVPSLDSATAQPLSTSTGPIPPLLAPEDVQAAPPSIVIPTTTQAPLL